MNTQKFLEEIYTNLRIKMEDIESLFRSTDRLDTRIYELQNEIYDLGKDQNCAILRMKDMEKDIEFHKNCFTSLHHAYLEVLERLNVLENKNKEKS